MTCVDIELRYVRLMDRLVIVAGYMHASLKISRLLQFGQDFWLEVRPFIQTGDNRRYIDGLTAAPPFVAVKIGLELFLRFEQFHDFLIHLFG